MGLGAQGREALELFVRELDRVDASTGGALLGAYSDEEVFEAAVCLLMRLGFLLKAEEGGLLAWGRPAQERAQGVLSLLTDLERAHRLDPGRLEHSTEAYARLLGSFRLVHEGSREPGTESAAHGGDLFATRSYPLLEGVPVRDSVVRDMLRCLESTRTLEVEQLGQLYEGLLECAIKRAPREGRVLLLAGTAKNPMPEMLEPGAPVDSEACLAELARQTGRSRAAILRRLRTWDGAVRAGGMYAGLGGGRREQGAHYTPPHLAELIVREALENVLHERDRRNPEALLSLAICDPSMGTGAFLIQVVRVLGGWLAEAWEDLLTTPDEPRAAPHGTVAVGHADEVLIPSSREERVLLARRLVAERCVYGVDRSALAVELARLSLWLVTAANDRPFSFIDPALVKGESLLGLHWARTFPAVFEGKGGFDIIVGNPPWGGKLSDTEKREIDSAFRLVGDYESAHAFFERSCELVRPGGHIALVLPDTVLRNDSASRLRAHLTRRLELRRVMDLSEGQVFRDASVRCCVIHVNRSAPTDAPVSWLRARAGTGELRSLSVVSIPKDRLPASEPWTRLSTRAEPVAPPVGARPRPLLSEFFEARQGYIPYRSTTLIARFGAVEGARIRDQRAWHADSRADEDCVRELQGADLKPLDVTWSGTWVRYGRWVSTYLDPRYFSGPRVLVREIVGRAPYFVIAAATQADYVHNPSILVLKPRAGMEHLVPLLSVYLNSRWVGEWLRDNGCKADKGLFPKVLVKDLRRLPFVPLSTCTESATEAARDLASRGGVGMDRQAVDAFVEHLLGGAR